MQNAILTIPQGATAAPLKFFCRPVIFTESGLRVFSVRNNKTTVILQFSCKCGMCYRCSKRWGFGPPRLIWKMDSRDLAFGWSYRTCMDATYDRALTFVRGDLVDDSDVRLDYSIRVRAPSLSFSVMELAIVWFGCCGRKRMQKQMTAFFSRRR